MAHKTQCPQCRKSARYSESEAGLPALCNACGARFNFPQALNGHAAADDTAQAQGRSFVRIVLPWLCAAVVVVAMATIAFVNARGIRSVPAPLPPLSLSDSVQHIPAAPGGPVDAPAASPRRPAVSASMGQPGAAPGAPATPVEAQPANLYLTLPTVQPLHIAGGLTDQQISNAIRKGVDFLMGEMDQQSFEVRGQRGDRSGHHAGLDALCVYALIMAGQTINDPRLSEHGTFITGCLNRLKQIPIEGHFSTYARALRATALAALNRPEDRNVLQQDAAWLVQAAHNGAYTYDALPREERDDQGWDNSNSQYGLLGVWVASEAGISITPGYWEAVQKHWVGCQLADGRWPYRTEDDGRLSMTCAGLASLFVTQEHLRPTRLASTGVDATTKALNRGLAWLEDGDNCMDIPRNGWPQYTYYGIERVGLASGYKYFGRHDWYRDLAGQLIEQQMDNGTWPDGDGVVNGAFGLLFLARGSHPLIMNKLRFAGAWNNHPDDLNHLAHYAGDQLERPLNWQIVPVDHAWQDWTDSPVLYIASDSALKLTDQQEQGLKSFVENGGMLLTSSDGESPEFNNWATELARRLFPNYPMQPISPKSDLFNVVLKLQKNSATSGLTLRGVSNGARLLMVQSDTDLSHLWQMGFRGPDDVAFDLGLNLIVYASGKAELRNRLSSLYVPPVNAAPLHTLNIVRLRYGGNWNPEPAAWERFGRVFQLSTSWGIKTTDVDVADLKPRSADVAVLTGTDTMVFSPAESAALANYVSAGGVLLIDSCGGRDAFQQSVETQLLPQAFPGLRPHPLSRDHPLLSAGLPGMTDLSKPHVRQYAALSPDYKPALPDMLQFGYGHVIYSPLDLTSGLLGTGTWGINGYTADYSIAFMKNLMLWTARGQKE